MGEKASNLKKDLESKLNEILELLDKEIRKPTVKNYYEIASTSANDEEVGKIITEYFLKVKDKSAIKIKESNSFKTYIEKINGYYFDGSLSSKMFLMNQNEVVLKDCYVLLIDGYLDDQYMITNIYNMMIEKQSNLIIVADSFSDEIISSTLEINLANDFKIILINSIDYVEKKKEILEDLEIITNAKIVKDDVISVDDLGFSKEVKCEIDKVTITANKSKSLNKHINKLTKLAKEIKKDYYLKDLKERINKLKNKMIFIYVGGYTKTEKKELMMRYEDALCSLNVSQQGILIGGGLTLLKISDFIDDAMIKEVLESPIKQIMDNSNLDYEELIKNIRKNNYQMIYNVKDNHYENIDKTKVLDSYLVVKKALETSFSIAIMMLTTSFLVINLNNEAKTIEI